MKVKDLILANSTVIRFAFSEDIEYHYFQSVCHKASSVAHGFSDIEFNNHPYSFNFLKSFVNDRLT